MSTNRHGTTGTGSGAGSLVRPGVGPTVATSSYTSLMHDIYSNHTLYYLASITRRVGDSRVHRLLPTQQTLYTVPKRENFQLSRGFCSKQVCLSAIFQRTI